MDRDEPWKIFAQAAQDPDSKTAKAVTRILDDQLNVNSRASFLRLFLLLLQHPLAEVLLAGLKRLGSITLLEWRKFLVPRLFVLLRSPFENEVTAAATVDSIHILRPTKLSSAIRSEKLPETGNI